MLKIYGSPRSRTFRCLWTLEELELPYENVAVNISQGENRRPEFLALNPAAKVPVLTDGKVTLFESSAICLYLAESYPNKNLIPPSATAARAYFYQWTSYITTELEQGLWTMFRHNVTLPPDKRLPAAATLGAEDFAKAAEAFERGLSGRTYLVDDRFSVADIFAGHTLLWAKLVELKLSPGLETYLDGLTKRPGYQRAAKLRV